jgi:hypothetical protein
VLPRFLCLVHFVQLGWGVADEPNVRNATVTKCDNPFSLPQYSRAVVRNSAQQGTCHGDYFDIIVFKRRLTTFHFPCVCGVAI